MFIGPVGTSGIGRLYSPALGTAYSEMFCSTCFRADRRLRFALFLGTRRRLATSSDEEDSSSSCFLFLVLRVFAFCAFSPLSAAITFRQDRTGGTP